jgi:hypothetical protein
VSFEAAKRCATRVAVRKKRTEISAEQLQP